MSAVIENFLSRLQKVRRTGQGSWKACCPAHNDTNPSLSVSVGREGAVLVRCWAGCSFAEIVEAVGVNAAELFPEALRAGSDYRPAERRPFPAADVLASLEPELMIAAIAVFDAASGKPFSEDDRERFNLCAERILRGIEFGCGRPFTSDERQRIIASSKLTEQEEEALHG